MKWNHYYRIASMSILMATTLAATGCSTQSFSQTETSEDTLIQETQIPEATSDSEGLTTIETIPSFSSETAAETSLPDIEETEAINPNDATQYQEAGILVSHQCEATSDESGCETLTIQSLSDGSDWTYKGEVGPIGQYDTLTYVVLKDSIAIVDRMELSLVDLHTKEIIKKVDLTSYYNGGNCKDAEAFYLMQADGPFIIKFDYDGNKLWEVDLSAKDYTGENHGGGGILELEGDVLHCYYEFSDFSRIDIKATDGSFLEAVK